MISLAADNDPIVSNIGLQGMVNLVNHDVYRKAFRKNLKLMDILNVSFMNSPVRDSSITFLCMIFFAILKNEGKIKDQTLVSEKLIKIVSSEHFPTDQNACWRVSCMLVATILSEDGSTPILPFWTTWGFSLLNRSVQNRLVDDYLDLYQKFQASGKGNIAAHRSFLDTSLAQLLFERLGTLDPISVSKVLPALLSIVSEMPCMIYDLYLEPYFVILVRLLDTTNEKQKKSILKFFHALAKHENLLEKRFLEPSYVVQLLEFLKQDVTRETIDVIPFIWLHVTNIESIFVDAEVLPFLLSIVGDKKNSDRTTILNKIEKILLMILTKCEYGSHLYSQMSTSLKEVIEADNSKDSGTLQFVMKLCVRSLEETFNEDIAFWLVNEGFEIVFRRLSAIDKEKMRASDLHSHLSIAVNNIVEKLEVLKEKLPLPKIFHLTLKASDFCDLKFENLHQHFSAHFTYFDDVQFHDMVEDIRFDTESMKLLASFLKPNEKPMGSFKELQLKILLNKVLKGATHNAIGSTGILVALAAAVNLPDLRYSNQKTNEQLLLCITNVLANQQMRSSLLTTIKKSEKGRFIDNLLFLYSEFGLNVCISESERHNILECISGHTICYSCRPYLCTWWCSYGIFPRDLKSINSVGAVEKNSRLFDLAFLDFYYRLPSSFFLLFL